MTTQRLFNRRAFQAVTKRGWMNTQFTRPLREGLRAPVMRDEPTPKRLGHGFLDGHAVLQATRQRFGNQVRNWTFTTERHQADRLLRGGPGMTQSIVLGQVGTLRRKYLDVLRPIVVALPIDVMNHFARLERTAQFLFSNEDRARYVPMTQGARMIRTPDLDIAPVGVLPALPVVTIGFSHLDIVAC